MINVAFLRFLAIVLTILFVEAQKDLARNYQGTCHDVSTSFTVDGDGNTIFLDRQRPNCGLTGMRSYHLKRNSGLDRVRYDLKCCNFPQGLQCTTEVRNTQFNLDGDGNVIFLDRHSVSCPDKGILQMFHLERFHVGVMYRINYQCCKPKTAEQRSHMSCYNDHTPDNSDGNGNMVYLDRHRPSCHIGYFLNGFQLVRPSSSTIRYNYKCCGYINPN